MKKPGKNPGGSGAGEVLPQNIVSMGEPSPEDKSVYISQKVYKELHRFAKNKVTVESGGVLMGKVTEAFGRKCVIISGFIPAKHCDATPTTLTFTHAAWEHIHAEAKKRFPECRILGWIHTHPDFGIFLSEYDRFIQENFFHQEDQVAFVIDPVQKKEGFYFWNNGKIERCGGFFVYERVGGKITLPEKTEPESSKEPRLSRRTSAFLMAALGLLALVLLIGCIRLNARVRELNAKTEAIVSSANENLEYMSGEIAALREETEALRKKLAEYEPETDSAAVPAEEPGEDGETDGNE